MSSTSSSLPGSMIQPSISQASMPTTQICAGAPNGVSAAQADQLVELLNRVRAHGRVQPSSVTVTWSRHVRGAVSKQRGSQSLAAQRRSAAAEIGSPAATRRSHTSAGVPGGLRHAAAVALTAR